MHEYHQLHQYCSAFLFPVFSPSLRIHPINIPVPAAYAIDGFDNNFYFRGSTSSVGIKKFLCGKKPDSFPFAFGENVALISFSFSVYYLVIFS